MNKRTIENCGISSLPLTGADVARKSRDSRTLTLRHVWPESTDARVWHAVSQAYREYARDVARQTGRTVEVYSADGHMLDSIEVAS